MRTRKEEIANKVTIYTLYLVFISTAYVMRYEEIYMYLFISISDIFICTRLTTFFQILIIHDINSGDTEFTITYKNASVLSLFCSCF